MLDLDDAVRRALAEDLGGEGDVTSRAVIAPDVRCEAVAIGKAEGVISGLKAFVRTFELVDPSTEVELIAADGDSVEDGTRLARVSGSARSVFTGERVALNFLTHLSGVATLTRKYVRACEGTGSKILCTRKTLPGLRSLERAAVAHGGGRLHRSGLHDGILIKDNHVRVAGGVRRAVRLARENAPHTLRVEVEVETLDELREALDAEADVVLLDNADLETVKRAVELVDGRVPLEISGSVRLEHVADLAAAGDVLISVGRLTHSAPALDVSLEVEVTDG